MAGFKNENDRVNCLVLCRSFHKIIDHPFKLYHLLTLLPNYASDLIKHCNIKLIFTNFSSILIIMKKLQNETDQKNFITLLQVHKLTYLIKTEYQYRLLLNAMLPNARKSFQENFNIPVKKEACILSLHRFHLWQKTANFDVTTRENSAYYKKSNPK
jgi:hypothetical protein